VTKAIIGVDIGGTWLRAARFDADLAIVNRAELPSHAEEGSDAVVSRLIDVIRQVLPGSSGDVLGVGLGAPGPLDPKEGLIIKTPNLPWENLPLARILREALGCAIYLGNDADVAGLAEHRFGAGKGTRHMVYMTLSTGIGGGVIVDGKLLTGRGQGGEIGHMTILPDGPMCGCGHPGHLEAVASGTAIARIARERLAAGERSAIQEAVGGDLSHITAETVGVAANAGDALARAILQQAGRYIGMSIASLMHLLNPEMFVLGGGLTKIGDLLFDNIHEAVREYAMHPRYWENTPIVRAALGEDVGLLGAAALVMMHACTKKFGK
jgi:glucokinase